jgi:hypothetical protein
MINSLFEVVKLFSSEWIHKCEEKALFTRIRGYKVVALPQAECIEESSRLSRLCCLTAKCGAIIAYSGVS